jgi:hypothetical protein
MTLRPAMQCATVAETTLSMPSRTVIMQVRRDIEKKKDGQWYADCPCGRSSRWLVGTNAAPNGHCPYCRCAATVDREAKVVTFDTGVHSA